MNALACELLLIVVIRHHLWPFVPIPMQGAFSKAMGAAMVLVLLSMVYRLAPRSKALLGALAVASFYQLQTLLCSTAYMVDPWPLIAGQGMCAGWTWFDFGALGLVCAAYLAIVLIPVNSNRCGKRQ